MGVVVEERVDTFVPEPKPANETPEQRAYRRSRNHWRCRQRDYSDEGRPPTPLPDAVPRFATRRRPGRKTLGHLVAQVADSLGQPLMPWQIDIVMVGLEYELVNGQMRFFYDTVFYTLPRQSGKSYLAWCIAITRCMVTPASVIAWTAQDQSAASQKWKKEFFPLFETSEKLKSRGKCYRTNGKESVDFHETLSSMVCATSKEDAGHGPTLMGGFMDEIWDVAIEVMDGLDPSLSRDDSQNWLFSTAGLSTSEFYLNMQEAGRAAVESDEGSGLAYIEYSAHGMGATHDDEDRWHEYMPSLGYMTSYRLVRSKLRKAKERQKLNGFIRGYQNLTDVSGIERVLPEQAWDDCSGRWAPNSLNPGDRIAFGLEGTYDRDKWTIAIAVNGKVGMVDRGEFDSITGVVERCNELTETWAAHQAEVFVDLMGPAGAVEGLNNRRVVASAEVNAGAASFLDAVVKREVQVRPDARLDKAAAQASKRKTGDRWQWFRVQDTLPVLACSLALRGSSLDAETREPHGDGSDVYDEDDFELIVFN